MRPVVAAVLFVAACAFAVAPDTAARQPKQPEKKAQPKVDPKTFIPDAETLKTIKAKTEELRKAVAALKAKKIADDVLIEVEIYLKAAENIVRFEEWLAAASVKWALTTLDLGLARAKQAEGGQAVWRDAPGKWVVRAYRSSIDNSIQPYAVLLPHEYGKDPAKKWRLDVVLHGRDGSLTEAKFIATHNGTAPKELGYVQLEVYGRGNNAYRWAGEADVFEAKLNFWHWDRNSLEPNRTVLRGFSMGGAGTWHLGLHHPCAFCVIGPGAGFTTTHGYIASLPRELPDYQEKCLRIYDAVGYAENAFNVPVVAYSGEKDAQKKAADNIENALKGFKEPLRFTHLIAPDLEHQMPKEWQEKAETEYRKYADKGRTTPERIRFVTYTPKYGHCDWLTVWELERQYERALVDAHRQGGTYTIETKNIRGLRLAVNGESVAVLDGQKISLEHPASGEVYVRKVNGKWASSPRPDLAKAFPPTKCASTRGPIDDAFAGSFSVLASGKAGFHPAITTFADAARIRFAREWDRYFRGALPEQSTELSDETFKHTISGGWLDANFVLFGDPQSNPFIAKVLPKLPITWTKDELVVNGVKYDPKTHVPVLIYPNPLNPSRYVVINSGHTFKEADLKGTNALLYPRLGDWAVIKPTPTEKDPAAYEVVAAGLFDENWQFPKKK